MSKFIKVTPLGALEPMLLNTDVIYCVGRLKHGKATILYKGADKKYVDIQEPFEEIERQLKESC